MLNLLPDAGLHLIACDECEDNRSAPVTKAQINIFVLMENTLFITFKKLFRYHSYIRYYVLFYIVD